MSRRSRHVASLSAALFLAMLAAIPAAWAHETRPAYLEIKETAPGQFGLLWSTPVTEGIRLPVALELPSEVRDLKEPSAFERTDSHVERRWLVAGPSGLAGRRINFAGLEATFTDVLVRVEMLDGRSWTTIVHPSQPWVEIAASQSKLGLVGHLRRRGRPAHPLRCRSFAVRDWVCCSS